MAPRVHFSGSMMKSLLVAVLLVAGCTVGDPGPGGGTGTGTGTGTGGGGGGGGGGGATPDAGVTDTDGGAAAACTGAVYDPCTDASQCQSGMCQLYQQAGIQVCTQTCTPGDSTTCPMQNGQPAQCNNMGLCKPAAANSCTR